MKANEVTRGMTVIFGGLYAIVTSKGLNEVTIQMNNTGVILKVGYHEIYPGNG